MANSYTKACFTIDVSIDEADALAAVDDAVAALEDAKADETVDLAARYAQLCPAFRAAFPVEAEDPFASFRRIFADLNYPVLDFDIDEAEREIDGRVRFVFAGQEFGIEEAANIIFAVCKSALPFGFEYALDCDRLRIDEFGGGYVVIAADGISYHGSRRGLDRALSRARRGADPDADGADGYVLTIRNDDVGLLFWNTADGYGDLKDASVFSDADASANDTPISDDAPEWLALPPPLAL